MSSFDSGRPLRNMEIYRTPTEIKSARPAAVALGFFDGLHIGHAALISRCARFARTRGLLAAVFTFREHPKNVMAGKMIVPRLLTEDEKLERLAALGVDRVFNFAFEDGFHAMNPERFARDMLKNAFDAKAVFCGFNFHFGANATGDTNTLQSFGGTLGFETFIESPVYQDDRLVSSTLIRRCVNDGEVEPAARLLGRDYALSGVVMEGRRIGRTFGFPTANFAPNALLTLPAYGVYVAETRVKDTLYPSVVNVGVNPTVSKDGAVRVETHLLDAAIDLYGQTVEVRFKKQLRDERRFESADALKRQIAADADTARRWFK